MGEARMGVVAMVVLLLAACGTSAEERESAPSAPSAPSLEGAMADEAPAVDTGGGRNAKKGSAKIRRKPKMSPGRRPYAAKRSAASAAMAEKESARMSPPAEAPAEVEEQRVRSWFPEAFIWEPVVVTDENGLATVPVRVPDTLTDWRVLGLAHDRTGQQAGALTGFASRLPVSADPRLPSFLFVGDRLKMPVRAMNGTDAGLSVAVSVEAAGAMEGGGRASLSLGPRGVGVRTINLRATKGGQATVFTEVVGGGHTDSSERSLRVTPTGRPIEASVRGTLTATTSLNLPDLEGVVGEQLLDVVVFPGPMSLVQAEVDRMAAGARPALAGSALQAIDHLLMLGERTGVSIDEKVLRRLKLLAWQQLAREVRTADWLQTVGLLRGVSSRDLVGAVESARPGMVRKVLAAQKPDGTWSSEARSTLQRVLVQTATAAMVLPEGNRSARLKAEGAVERQLPNIKDAYTAAVLLGSGVLHGEIAEPARVLLREALERDEAGSPRVVVPDGVVDAWGIRPTQTAMLAWTVLALVDDPESAVDRGVLAAELIGSWSAEAGFSAGRADPIALAAVVAAVPGASGKTTVSLWQNDKEVSRGVVDPAQPGIPLVLSTMGGPATLKLDPPVEGLAYTAIQRGYAPWPEAPAIPGFDWEWMDAPLVVGESSTVGLRVSAPRGTALQISVGLPAGMKVNEEALKANPLVRWAVVLEDRVGIQTAPLPGVGAELPLLVTPSFAGEFHTLPLKISIPGQGELVLPGRVWEVR